MRIRESEDLLDREVGKRFTIPPSTMFGQNARKALAGGKSTGSFSQGAVNGDPGFSRQLGNGAGLDGRPITGPEKVCVGPTQNLLQPQCRQFPAMPQAAVFSKQIGQGRISGKSARSMD